MNVHLDEDCRVEERNLTCTDDRQQVWSVIWQDGYHKRSYHQDFLQATEY